MVNGISSLNGETTADSQAAKPELQQIAHTQIRKTTQVGSQAVS
jgi:hypothetical protein